jgi:hypothetical protein
MSDPAENDAPTGPRINAFSVIGLLALITGVLLFALVSDIVGIVVIAVGVLLAVTSIIR